MDDVFLVVFNINSKYYLSLADNGSLSAYRTSEEVMDAFKHFKTKLLSSDYETHISGGWGLMSILPFAIKLPADKPEAIHQYLLDDKVTKFTGGTVSGLGKGAEVNETIVDLKAFDIYKQMMEEITTEAAVQEAKIDNLTELSKMELIEIIKKQKKDVNNS